MVNRVEYLGIIIQASDVFELAEKHLADKAQKASFILKRGIVADRSNLISPKVALSLFQSYVKPILTYGSEIWSVATSKNFKTATYFRDPHTQNVVNVQFSGKVLSDYCKFVLGVGEKTSNLASPAELGM